MQLFLRGLLPTDEDLLFRWRNDPETRANSSNTAEISPKEHADWFSQIFAEHRQNVLIATKDGVDVGTVRPDWSEDRQGCDLSFTVAPERGGKGLGSAIVKHALKNMTNARVCAEVKVNNVASRRIFEKLDFKVIDTQGDVLMYAKDFY